jgi:hypothetical protein
VRREHQSQKGVFFSVHLCCIRWHMGQKRRTEEFSFHCVLVCCLDITKHWCKRWESAMRAARCLLLSLLIVGVLSFCSVHTTHVIHCIMARRGQSPSLLVQTRWRRWRRRWLLHIYIALGSDIPGEQEARRYTYCTNFTILSFPLKSVFSLRANELRMREYTT